MRKVVTVAIREFNAAVRTKAFILSLVIMPVLMGGAIIVQAVVGEQVDTADRKVAVVDRSGELYAVLAAAAEQRNATGIYGGQVSASDRPALLGVRADLAARITFDDGEQELRFTGRMTEAERDELLGACSDEAERRQIAELHTRSQEQAWPRYVLEAVDPGSGGPEEIRSQLKQRVDDREIFAFVEIAEDAVLGRDAASEASAEPSIVYYTARTTYHDLRNWLAGPINEHIRRARIARTGLNGEEVAWATEWVQPRMRHVRSIDETGQHKPGEETNELVEIFVPMGMMMLMFMVVMVGSSPLMQSVLEEKMQKISEVLVASVPPFELMLGKLLGMVGVALTIVGVYLIGGYAAMRHYGYADFLPGHLFAWFLVYQVLAVILFGSLFVAIGSACSDMKEAQSMMGPVMLLVCLPLFVWINVVQEPNSTFALVASFVPTATPMLMIARLAADPKIALWQPLLGVTAVLLTTIFFVWAAGRIFRVGVLMQGKGAKVREMVRWVVRG